MLNSISEIRDFIRERTRTNNYTKCKRCSLESDELVELNTLLDDLENKVKGYDTKTDKKTTQRSNQG